MSETIKIFNAESNELLDEFDSSRRANDFVMNLARVKLGHEYKRSTIRFAMNHESGSVGVVKKLGLRVVKTFVCSYCGGEKSARYRAFPPKILCDDCKFCIDQANEPDYYG